MTPDTLTAAYAPFVASLRAGGFRPPLPGTWPAELIAAHVASNNDLIALAAEKVAAGADGVAYDNAGTVDEAVLARYAESAGGLPGLAAEIERSAERLAAAGAALGDRAGTLVPVIIRDNGQIVQDGPIPIGAFVEGNATFHLDLHLEQLKELEPVRDPAQPPAEFDHYQLILLQVAPGRADLSDEESSAIGRQHLGHFRKMAAAGYLKVAGPIDNDDEIAGICLYQAGSVARARALAEDDPAVRAGRFIVRAMDWFTQKDAVSFQYPLSSD
jgi:uncharacterized protein YciI